MTSLITGEQARNMQCSLYLENELVDEARGQAAEEGPHPVHPVVGSGPGHQGGAQASGWVHARTLK